MYLKITVLLLSILIPSIISAQKSRSDYWQKRTAFFKKEAETVDTGKVVFLGNSFTEGFDLQLFFPESGPVNRGISGDNIEGVLERFDNSVLRLKPSKLFLMIGINDIGARHPDSLIQANYQFLLRTILQSLPNTKVYIQSILPTTAVWANCPVSKIQRINRYIEDFSTRFGFTWIDLYSKFATNDGYLKDVFTIDGMHLNSKGYVYWSTILKKYGLK